MAKLCITVTGRTTAEFRARRDAVVGADLVELRVDTVTDPDAAGALQGRKLPVVFTCRPAWEGGHFTGPEETRHRLLAEAQRLGAEYVDIEWHAGFGDLLATLGRKSVVVSRHDFAGTPADVPDVVRAMRAEGADVVKLAVTAHSLRDVLALRTLGSEGARSVLLAMGETGLITRILPDRFGSEWTYAGDAVAPGQVPATRLCHEYGFDLGPLAAHVYAVVGRPIAHSLSPAMHNAAFRALSMRAIYVPLAPADFADFTSCAAEFGIDGASVTAPFKHAALAAATGDALSNRVDAANTLKRRPDGWDARNTDVEAFIAPLRQRLSLAGRRVTVLGAGGAARAAVAGLTAENAHVTISARHADRAHAVAAALGVTTSPWPPPPDWEVLVNATPVGTWPSVNESPLPLESLGRGLVYDLVYNPVETRLLRDARGRGLATIDGLDMLVGQAARQFAWWTGVPAPVDVMRHAAVAALAARRHDALCTQEGVL